MILEAARRSAVGPFSFVVDRRRPPISAGDVTRTTAPGRTPPCASRTVPTSAPVNPCADSRARAHDAAAISKMDLFTHQKLRPLHAQSPRDSPGILQVFRSGTLPRSMIGTCADCSSVAALITAVTLVALAAQSPIAASRPAFDLEEADHRRAAAAHGSPAATPRDRSPKVSGAHRRDRSQRAGAAQRASKSIPTRSTSPTRLDAERKSGHLRGPLHGIPVLHQGQHRHGGSHDDDGRLAGAGGRSARRATRSSSNASARRAPSFSARPT